MLLLHAVITASSSHCGIACVLSALYITTVELDTSSITSNTITHFVSSWCIVTDPCFILAL